MKLCLSLILAAVAQSLAAGVEAKETVPQTVEIVAPDGIAIFGETYFSDLPKDAPLIMLIHQAGSDGRGEYGPLIPWLNQAGFRAIAWDFRAGGDRFGNNRAVAAMGGDGESDYCAAYTDFPAALDHVLAQGWAGEVVLWGSSYSASLIFRLAAERPEAVSGVIAFSPAGGGPMTDCRPRIWAEDIAAPVFVLRPVREMEIASSQEQRDILGDTGADFRVVENGVHGSSMLVDERTGEDMSTDREAVLMWLRSISR